MTNIIIHGLTADGKVDMSGPGWIFERETDGYIREDATTDRISSSRRSEETTRETRIEVDD